MTRMNISLEVEGEEVFKKAAATIWRLILDSYVTEYKFRVDARHCLVSMLPGWQAGYLPACFSHTVCKCMFVVEQLFCFRPPSSSSSSSSSTMHVVFCVVSLGVAPLPHLTLLAGC